MAPGVAERTALSAEQEVCWRELKQQLDWAEDFSLVVLSSDDGRALEVFRRRLARQLRLGASGLQEIVAATPADLTHSLWQALRDGEDDFRDLQAPCWLSLRGRDPDWLAARRQVLTKLNENREWLRRHFRRSLILVLDSDGLQAMRNLAPDLWSIRDLSLQLPATAAGDVSADRGIADRSTAEPGSGLRDSAAWREAQQLLDEWQRSGAARERKHQTPRRSDLRAGWRATEALLAAGRWPEARQIAEAVGEMAQAVGETLGETPQTLRDLCLSLYRVAGVGAELQRADAGDCQRRGLALARRLAQALPDQPEYAELPGWFE